MCELEHRIMWYSIRKQWVELSLLSLPASSSVFFYAFQYTWPLESKSGYEKSYQKRLSSTLKVILNSSYLMMKTVSTLGDHRDWPHGHPALPGPRLLTYQKFVTCPFLPRNLTYEMGGGFLSPPPNNTISFLSFPGESLQMLLLEILREHEVMFSLL